MVLGSVVIAAKVILLCNLPKVFTDGRTFPRIAGGGWRIKNIYENKIL